MIQKIKTSYELVKVSFKFIKRDGELLVYSLLSIGATLAIILTFAGVNFMFIDDLENTLANNQLILYGWIFLMYTIFSFVTFFFNTAIITSVNRRLQWQDNKFMDWIRDAMSHWRIILQWSLISALVSTILKAIQSKFWEDSIVGKIIVWIIWWTWAIMTFFSFPIMILKGKWPKEAIGESASLFKKTWGERAIIHVWVWLFFFFIFLVVIWLWFLVISSWFIMLGIILMVLLIMLTWVTSMSTDVVIKTILFHYAETWELPEEIENKDLLMWVAGNK